MKEKFKEFFGSSWAINNPTSIYVITVIVMLWGIVSYISIPKERFPDIIIPTIYVSTIYPGASPADMENLVTKHLEKEIKGISGIKKMTSNSVQDYSNVIVEFNTDVEVSDAKRKVKDAVDKAKSELPSDLPNDPTVQEIDFSEQPILFINLSGDFDLKKLKKYADDAKDRIEGLKEITRVDIVGALDREIQVNVDMYKMQAAEITLNDIASAIGYENVTVSGGTVNMEGLRRSLSVKGDFTNVDQIKGIVIHAMSGSTVYLKDIAEVKDGFKEKESYARLDHKNVITLNIIKRSGENLIEASDKCRDIVTDLQRTEFPPGLTVTLTGDQSNDTRTTLHDLINTIIIGFILVTLILLFFMGATNAIFVALSVPLSMCIAFIVMPSIGFSMNMIVLFSFLLALGIVVDDAIVVIENTHRIFANGRVAVKTAAKKATGEVFLPVLAGTLTTLSPFIPLAFWPGIIGKFMLYLPITLIVTLLASLVVAYFMNPVFAVSFMKPHSDKNNKEAVRKSTKNLWIVTGIFVVISIVFKAFAFQYNFVGNHDVGDALNGIGNFLLVILGLIWLNWLVLEKWSNAFQLRLWPKVQEMYERFMTWVLSRRMKFYLLGLINIIISIPVRIFFMKERRKRIEHSINAPLRWIILMGFKSRKFVSFRFQVFKKKFYIRPIYFLLKRIIRPLNVSRPAGVLVMTFLLLIFSFVFFNIRKPGVVFFPAGEPHFIYTYITLPVGTDQKVTDSITQIVEGRIYKVLGEDKGKKNPIVESVISNVAVGATDPNSGDRSVSSNKSKVSVSFVDVSKRNGINTWIYLDSIRKMVKGIPLAQITVDKEANGPPTDKPINIEISGDNFDELIKTSEGLRTYLDSIQIPGVEELKTDLLKYKPEIVIDIDRERANREGISTGQIGMEIRNAVYGKEASKYKDKNDEYPIQVRYEYDQRNNIDALLNLKIVYRDMNLGGAIRQVPLSSVASIRYDNTLGGITRKNQKRVVTIYSNILKDYIPKQADVVANVTAAAANYHLPPGVLINLTGEQEQQKETGAFLMKALAIALGLIFLILVTQFNSVSKPFIILTEIVFSIIGVLLGVALFKMDMSIVMTGVGIVALAGIVVRNGILLIEFSDVLRLRGYDIKTAAIHAGKIRMTPVLLTASATILGLIPLAVGMNIDFVELFTHFKPNIWFGGDSVAFWGPLSWTIIFGLSFATLITLVLVPAMYLMTEKRKLKRKGITDYPVKPFNDADIDD